MDIEQRVKRLEDIVTPAEEEHHLGDVVTGVYSNLIQHLISTGDFLFDLVNHIENYLTNVTSMIPEEILDEIKKMEDEQSKEILRLVTTEEETT
tara:strand:+ start:485 stop:766 length:282 start_codon:yes stop_codon:yes gene_type:complete